MSLIIDEETTKSFAEALKARRKDGTSPCAYYFQIMTREKYGSFTNLVLFRKIIKLDNLVEEIHRATPFRGFYVDGKHVPHESLACYLTPEPRDVERACKQTCSQFILKEDDQEFNMPSKFMSECQKIAAERRILDVDVDDPSKFPAVLEKLEALQLEPEIVIQSRGGYHLLCFDVDAAANKALYDMAKELGDIDLLKNSMVPIPGTMQGGREVKWLR